MKKGKIGRPKKGKIGPKKGKIELSHNNLTYFAVVYIEKGERPFLRVPILFKRPF